MMMPETESAGVAEDSAMVSEAPQDSTEEVQTTMNVEATQSLVGEKETLAVDTPPPDVAVPKVELMDAGGVEDNFDVEKIVRAAEEAMLLSGDPAPMRAALDGALLEWEDMVREGAVEAEEREKLQLKIVELYLAYAGLERSLRQFKQAAKVYDTASVSVVASASPKFWLEYAAFAIDRKKYETAKELYTRAIKTLPDDQVDPIWEALVVLMRHHLGEPDTTADTVRTLVFPEQRGDEAPPAKVPRLEAQSNGIPLIFSFEAEEIPLDQAGLDAKQTADFVKLAREPTLVEVVEGCRVIAILQTAEIEETWAAARQSQARRLREAPDTRARQICLETFQLENAELLRTANVELKRLNHGVQSILKQAGLPLLTESDDPELVHRQRAVVLAVLDINKRTQDTQLSLQQLN